MAIDWEDVEEERDPGAEVESLISKMDRFVDDLPLTAHLQPYRNPYCPDLVYPAVVLNEFFADVPGQGAGTTYLDELKRLCDASSITLYTDAEGPRSCDYYLKQGFEKTVGRRDHQLDEGPQGHW